MRIVYGLTCWGVMLSMVASAHAQYPGMSPYAMPPQYVAPQAYTASPVMSIPPSHVRSAVPASPQNTSYYPPSPMTMAMTAPPAAATTMQIPSVMSPTMGAIPQAMYQVPTATQGRIQPVSAPVISPDYSGTLPAPTPAPPRMQMPMAPHSPFGPATPPETASPAPPITPNPGNSSPLPPYDAGNPGGYPPEAGPVYDTANSPFNAALQDPSGCYDAGYCDPPRAVWFGSLSGLIMTRDRPNGVWLSYFNDNPGVHAMESNDAEDDWRGGYEVRLGRTFCQCWAVEGVFWTLSPFHGQASVTSPSNDLSSALDWTGVSAGGTAMSDLYNNASYQQVLRNDEIYNIEINTYRQVIGSDTSRFGATAIAGSRYFRFAETVQYDSTIATFGNNTSTGFYNNKVTNDLMGGQIGARLHYYALNNLRLYVTPKVGVYANQISGNSTVYRGDGATAFDLVAHKEDVTILSQLDFGASWQMLPKLSAFLGYRAVAVSGLALADNQIPFHMNDTQGLTTIMSNGSLILHGAIAGVQFAH